MTTFKAIWFVIMILGFAVCGWLCIFGQNPRNLPPRRSIRYSAEITGQLYKLADCLKP